MKKKKDKKVIIFGVLRDGDYPIEAPYLDKDYEIWCMNQSWEPPFWHRWFHLHGYQYILENASEGMQRIKWLRTVASYHQPYHSLWVFDKWLDKFPGAYKFPKDELIERYGSYFTGSFAWLVALANYEGFDEIWVNAGSMKGEEWAIPCINYHLGIAYARGARIFADEASGILSGVNGVTGTKGLYGYDPEVGGY